MQNLPHLWGICTFPLEKNAADDTVSLKGICNNEYFA